MKIGQACLICYKEDKRPATIIKIISEKKIVVKGPESFTRNFTLRKNNKWVETNENANDGTHLVFML